VDRWVVSKNSSSSSTSNYGSYYAEIDIWEANSISIAFTPYSAENASQTMCTRDLYGGVGSINRYTRTTNLDGCDFNSYYMGDTIFYSPYMKVDTESIFTIIT
jgi:cellulose 1,4-beta-cellobiosidase